jgi:hypothetical protein
LLIDQIPQQKIIFLCLLQFQGQLLNLMQVLGV